MMQNYHGACRNWRNPWSWEEWAHFYKKLLQWELKLDESPEEGLKGVLAAQKKEANELFEVNARSKLANRVGGPVALAAARASLQQQYKNRPGAKGGRGRAPQTAPANGAQQTPLRYSPTG